jgi:hypothetical protein
VRNDGAAQRSAGVAGVLCSRHVSTPASLTPPPYSSCLRRPCFPRVPCARAGNSFGPDITKAFLTANGLSLLVRSHEVMEEGFQIMHGGACITVFSAPNYCDQMTNKGGIVRLDAECTPHCVSFTHVRHPPIRPMAYAAGLGSAMGF